MAIEYLPENISAMHDAIRCSIIGLFRMRPVSLRLVLKENGVRSRHRETEKAAWKQRWPYGWNGQNARSGQQQQQQHPIISDNAGTRCSPIRRSPGANESLHKQKTAGGVSFGVPLRRIELHSCDCAAVCVCLWHGTWNWFDTFFRDRNYADNDVSDLRERRTTTFDPDFNRSLPLISWFRPVTTVADPVLCPLPIGGLVDLCSAASLTIRWKCNTYIN